MSGLLPLLTADETRKAEEAHSGPMEELMERAGTAVADVVDERFPNPASQSSAAQATTAATGGFAPGSLARAGPA